MRSFVALVFAAATLAAPAVAAADAPAASRDTEVARLLEAKDTLRWTQVWAGQRYGHAETLIRAPFEAVKKEIADHGKLPTTHARFAASRVVAQTADHTDVWFKLPSADADKPAWEVLRFGAPKAQAGYALVEARAIAGNTRHGHLVVSARQVDARHTLVKVDVLLVPNRAPAPAVLDEELRGFASDLAGGLRFRAQGTSDPVTSLAIEPARLSAR